jgi:phosphoribosylaminoimidazole-succinocarboxamide synthase
MKIFGILSDFLQEKGIVIYDLCLFISTEGKIVFGEISPDCGRFRHYDLGELDKDVWRAGGSSDDVIKKWNLLYTLITE